MMINKSKLAFIAAVASLSIAPPALAQTAPHRYLYNYAPDRPAYDYAPGAGDVRPLNPDSPAATGGGSLGYNKCAGHSAC